MISMIDILILSYINKFDYIDLNEIKSAINEPIGLIVQEVVRLYDEEYFKKYQDKYRLTDKGLSLNVSVWNTWLKDKGDEFSIEENYPVKRNSLNMPYFENISDLHKILKLEHIDVYSYHNFNISNGKKERLITSPSKNLKQRQKWILNYILYNFNAIDCAHGFTKTKSIVTNAKCHVNKKEIGCLDIKDFFPSISAKQIFDVFRNFGYGEELAMELCKLCTYEDCLPQGAPTSPMLSNIVFAPIDSEILQYSKENNLVYTRYADDITISADEDISNHLCEVKKIIQKYGFEINEQKTHIMKDNYRKMVTGLVVTDTVKVPQKFKRKFRQEIYYCEKFGVEQHLKNIGRKSAVNFKEYMYGKAYFIKMVEEDVGNKFLKELDQIFSLVY